MEHSARLIEDYLVSITPQDHPVLAEMEDRARKERFPIVGPLVGRLLYQLTRLAQAQRILELGSGFGYSAFWFGKAVGETGEMTLVEFSPENLELAERYLERGEIGCRIHFCQGDAREVLDSLQGEFDIVFNDVDKHQYPEVFAKAAPRVRPGGLLIADNILWHGRVLEADPDEDTRGILEYSRLIFNDPDFFSSIIPVRDGVAISLKRGQLRA